MRVWAVLKGEEMKTYAGQYGPEGIERPDGSHAILSPIAIKTLGGSPVTLYADRFRLEEVSNPVETDELGNLQFFAEPGQYLMQIGEWSKVIMVPEDPSEPDTGLTPEEREALAEDVAEDVLEELEPPVRLTLLFENALA